MKVLPTRWRRKPPGIDVNRNYTSVTLCIGEQGHDTASKDTMITFGPK